MKLHTGSNVVEKSGISEESSFSIEASAKAFFILSDGLYSNKIKAVVRELSTNAYDSHIDAGVEDQPFDVHLPTRLEPTFYVRDYGTSMSHEDCMQLYTTYFRSTRNDSNKSVGCLGLGSKAPFAYTDSFTVEAYLNGTRRLYTAYKDENGTPIFSLLDEVESDEPNGIKVSLSVDVMDIWDFKGEAKEVYKFFKVRPNFVGPEINFCDGEITLSGDNWEFERGDVNNYLIMGQIAYPIDEEQIKDNVAHTFLYKSSGLNIYANIGDVDITPSRESLSYNAATKDKITTIIQDIGLEIAASMEEQISDQDSLFKARMKYVELTDQCESVKVAMNALDASLTWNGQELFKKLMGNSIETGNVKIDRYSKDSWYKKIDVHQDLEKIRFHLRHKLVVNNVKRGGISRIRQYLKEEYADQSVYFYCFNATDLENNPKAADPFYNLLGGPTKEDVIFTSDLPKVEYNRSYSSGSSGPAVQAQVYNSETKTFEQCSMSVKHENAYYLKESRGEVTIKNEYTRTWSVSEVEKCFSTLESLGYDLSEYNFYLVKPSVIENRKLKDRANWHSGDEILVKLITQARDGNEDNLTKVRHEYSLSEGSNHKYGNVIRLTKTDSEIKQIVDEYDKYMEGIREIKFSMGNLYSIIHHCPGLNMPTSPTPVDEYTRFAKRFDEAMESYPMLDLTRSLWMERDNLQVCADYVDMINGTG